MNNLINVKKLSQVNNIGTYEANLKIIVKKIEAQDEAKTSLYMDKLLNSKNWKKIYDIIKEDNTTLYVYLDPNENIDDILNEDEGNEIQQASKGGPPALTLKNIEEIFELEKAMCKIKFQINERGRLITNYGSGCFIELNEEDFPFTKFLLTNNHVLDQEQIKGNKILDVYYNGKIKKINLSKRRRYTNKNLDYTCIEIFEEDNIEQYYYIDQRVFQNNLDAFKDEDIYILHYPLGGELSFSPGKIVGIKYSNIFHNCSTKGGSSGSPIISRYNSSIIGLHHGTHRIYNFNLAKDISSILNDIKFQSKNYIIAEFEIKTENINKDIKIINSFEQYRLEKGKNIKEEELKYKNEKMIKETCIIEINDKPIPFSHYYKFSEVGRFTIKYSFLNKLNDINSMFRDCFCLKSIDLSNFKCDNVTNTSFLLCNCFILERITLSNINSNFNTKNATDMNNMFSYCSSLEEINLLNLNTSKVTDMSYMFGYCDAISNLDFSNFDTKNVTNMSRMFYSCKSLKSIDLSHFNTENVTDMSFMFCGCSSIYKLDLSSFNTEKVKNMNTMFTGCSTIPELYLSNFKTSNTEDMRYMFSECSSLTSLDISNFSTEKIGNIIRISSMFQNCSNLLLMNLNVKDQKIIKEYNDEDKNS